jgi:multiple sugar transport system permease protein
VTDATSQRIARASTVRTSVGSRTINWVDSHIGWVMIAPALIVLASVSLYPFLFNVWLSTHNVELLNIRAPVWQWTGVRNFIRVLNDDATRASLLRTAIIAFWTVLLQMALGLLGAVAFNRAFVGKRVLMVLALVPMMATPIVVGIAWQMLLSYDWGVANYLLELVRLRPLQWLSDANLAVISTIVVQVWWGVSFVMLVLIGGLAAIPSSLYEAAEVDGATDARMFWYITLPLLRPILIVVATIKLIDALREFDIIYALTGGGPGDATRVFSLELYYTAYARGDFGMSAAQALLLLVAVLLLTVPLVRLLVRKDNRA